MRDYSLFNNIRTVTSTLKFDNLGEVSSICRRDFQERETLEFRSTAAGLEYCCLMVENALLLRTSRQGRIYVGFEKLSTLRPIMDRYMRIADISQSVFIFGEADWTVPRHPNIRVIPMKADYKLAREWFLITDSPALEIAVIAKHNGASEGQNFRVIKTSNPKVVRRLANAVEGVIDWSLAVSI